MSVLAHLESYARGSIIPNSVTQAKRFKVLGYRPEQMRPKDLQVKSVV
jgi:hypothetical protein